jgi:hypothetical protein
MPTSSGSSRPKTRSSPRVTAASTGGTSSNTAQTNSDANAPSEIMVQPVLNSPITNNTSVDNNALSEILEKLQQVQTTTETSLEALSKTIEHQEKTLLEEIEKTKKRLDVIEDSLKTRSEELINSAKAEAEKVTKEQTSETKDEDVQRKDQEGPNYDTIYVTTYDPHGEVAGDAMTEDQEDQSLIINSNSEGEGEYPDEKEILKRRSRRSTPSEKTKRTNSKSKKLNDSKRSKHEIARMRSSKDAKPSKTHSRKTKRGSGNPGDSSSSSSDEEKPMRNHSSYTSDEDEDEEDNDSSSDESVQFIPTKYRNLKNVRVRTSELKNILSYKTYRLRNQSQKFTTKMQKELSRIALRMKTHIADDQKFSGTDPVSIIRFLEEFKEACDHNGLSEGAALHLFQYFILDPAKKV